MADAVAEGGSGGAPTPSGTLAAHNARRIMEAFGAGEVALGEHAHGASRSATLTHSRASRAPLSPTSPLSPRREPLDSSVSSRAGTVSGGVSPRNDYERAILEAFVEGVCNCGECADCQSRDDQPSKGPPGGGCGSTPLACVQNVARSVVLSATQRVTCSTCQSLLIDQRRLRLENEKLKARVRELEGN